MAVEREPSISEDSSDAVAIARSVSDPNAFGVIFDRHFDAVHAYLARRAGRNVADDVAASTFTVAFERRRSFRREATTARPWLLGIATNLLRNERRAEQRAFESLARIRVRPLEAADGGGDGENAARLADALAGLDRGQRDVMLLYAWEELSYEEIAVALRVPVGTVRSRLARARAHLRAALGQGRVSHAREMSR
jgi:RNA polymerase sigma-70 factor (ECF subfamily)